MRIADTGGVCGHDDIAIERQRGAESGSRTVELGDDRLTAIEDGHHRALAFFRQGFPSPGVVDQLLKPVGIAAGAKRPSGTRQDNDIDGTVPVDLFEYMRQLDMHRPVDCVQSFGPVQRDRQYAVTFFKQQCFVFFVVHFCVFHVFPQSSQVVNSSTFSRSG